MNEALLAKAATGKLLRTDKVRADTTVVEAAVGYPTDSGLLAKAIGTMARTVARIKAAGAATRTPARDRRRSAGRRARSIASKLRLRGQQHRDQAQAVVRRITGELAGIAEAAMREATAVIGNAKRALRAASGPRKGRLHRAINDLSTLWDAPNGWWPRLAVGWLGGPGHGRFELEYVNGAIFVLEPSDGLVIGNQKIAFDGKGPPQVVNQLAQIGAGLGFT